MPSPHVKSGSKFAGAYYIGFDILLRFKMVALLGLSLQAKSVVFVVLQSASICVYEIHISRKLENGKSYLSFEEKSLVQRPLLSKS